MSEALRRWLHHPLTRNSAFMHLWAGQTAAEIGFQVGALSLIHIPHEAPALVRLLTGAVTVP